MIIVKDNLISRDKLKIVEHWLDKANWTYGWPSNKNIPFGHWNVDISRTVPNNPTDITARLPKEFKAIWDDIFKDMFNNQGKLIRCYANRHTFGTEGYIHTDSERKEDQTVVIYLNDWNAQWGGETTFYSSDKKEIIKAVLPSHGRVVSFPGNIPHCARGLTRIATGVRTTLMYKVTVDPKAIYPAEALLTDFLKEIGADRKPHHKGSLMDHLIRVYHALKDAGANDILALAGGLHSVYGTNAYKNGCLAYTSMKIEEVFGPEVDRIVKLFAKTDRPKVLETPDGTLSDADLFVLRAIECANLYDQGELNAKDYPNLTEFVKIFKKG